MSGSTNVEIPLSPTPQDLSVVLAGVSYVLSVRWNVAGSYWTVDIRDANKNKIIGSIPMVPGINLLGQFDYLAFGGGLYVVNDITAAAPPTFTELGITGHLCFVPSV